MFDSANIEMDGEVYLQDKGWPHSTVDPFQEILGSVKETGLTDR